MKFNEMNISDSLKKAIELLEFDTPTEIQEKAIPEALTGVDLIGQAQTGTGKTLSYAIPVVDKIDIEDSSVQALIMCPTRELSLQVYAEFIKLVKFSKHVRVVTIYGGQSIERQIRDLKDKPQIIIGTPGRIIDHMNRRTLKFDKLRTLVLDEADEMLKMGFIEDLEYILQTTPKSRQTLLFSATMPDQIKKVAKNYLNNPTNIKIEAKTLTVERIKQEYYEVKQASKCDLLIRLLDYYNYQSSIVFCNTKAMVDELVLQLQKNEYMVDGLHGDLKQMNRDRVMASFRNGNIKILVATDVAARGIDVNGVEAVFNYDLPLDDESYVHRIGRTGRAGKDGTSISFVNGRSKSRLRSIEQYTKSKMERKNIPSVEMIKKNAINAVYNDIVDMINSKPQNHLKTVNKLIAEGYDGIDIINALIELRVNNKSREYKEIEIEEPKKKSHSTSSVVYYHINIGKNEGMRPQILLPLINKITKIPANGVGDIKIKKSGTYFELKSDYQKKIQNLNGARYKKDVIKLRKVKSLES